MAKKEAFNVLDNVHPGFIIKMELRARGIKQKDFAERIAIQQSHLSEILKGNRNISDQMAETIADVLGIPAAHIIQLQATFNYKKKSAQIKDIAEHNAEMELREYNEIYDMRVIFRHLGIMCQSSSEKLQFCKSYLRFTSPTEQAHRAYGYFRKSEKTGLDNRMISTWSLLAQYEAEKQPTPMAKYDKTRLDQLSNELSEIFNDNYNTINRVARKFSDYGIKFCIVPKVERASIDGYSFIFNGQPSIVITKRYNRIDNMAFAVLHEVGHLKMHIEGDGERVTIIDDDELNTKEEREANNYASQVLLPDSIWQDAPEVLMIPHLIQQKYSAWAKKKGLNKWIVLGRISHDTGMYMFKSDKSREIQ
ncbi:MAG: helix-turn-helix domain-containing protein [Marinilabiliaceae bacterium]|nr:helix-turn-helix domain-containing protein [Marinilabiliaceae bacterium]